MIHLGRLTRNRQSTWSSTLRADLTGWRSPANRCVAGECLLTLVAIPAAAAMDDRDGGGSGGQGRRLTASVIVTAQNPGTSSRGSEIRISLTAQAPRAPWRTRPADRRTPPSTVGLAGLRIPESFAGIGGLAVTGFEEHRIAVGDISCDDSCEEDAATALATRVPGQASQAQVNSRAVVTDPGSTGLQIGATVQMKITLTDNGQAQYQDEIAIEGNSFVPGSNKPLLGATGPQTIQQVQIHHLGNGLSPAK